MVKRSIYLRGDLSRTTRLRIFDAETEQPMDGVKILALTWDAPDHTILGVAVMCNSHGGTSFEVEVVPGPSKKCPHCKGTGRYTGFTTEEDCEPCGGYGELPA